MGERYDCLLILSEVCREHVIFPKSYIISDVERIEKSQLGAVADVWTGKLGQRDVCIKIFRYYNVGNLQRIKAVGTTSFGGNATLPWIIAGDLPLRSVVEESFASQPGPFLRSF